MYHILTQLDRIEDKIQSEAQYRAADGISETLLFRSPEGDVFELPSSTAIDVKESAEETVQTTFEFIWKHVRLSQDYTSWHVCKIWNIYLEPKNSFFTWTFAS